MLMSEEQKKRYANVPPIGTYVRHAKTGDLGQVVEKDGELWIKPDLPGSPVYYPATLIYNWQIEPHAKRLPPGSWARVCYEAYRALCDIHPEMKRQPEWMSLKADVKAAWIENRVKFAKPLQLELTNAILKVLQENSE